jgi:hypothetical protein
MRAAYPRRVLDTLSEAAEAAEQDGSLWRCSDCTMAWVGGAWFRLSTFPTVTWTLMTHTPKGPFWELGKVVGYGDYRNHLAAPERTG